MQLKYTKETDQILVMTNYSITLQRCIEYHVSGQEIPSDIAEKAPYHSKMLNNKLIKEQNEV